MATKLQMSLSHFIDVNTFTIVDDDINFRRRIHLYFKIYPNLWQIYHVKKQTSMTPAEYHSAHQNHSKPVESD